MTATSTRIPITIATYKARSVARGTPFGTRNSVLSSARCIRDSSVDTNRTQDNPSQVDELIQNRGLRDSDQREEDAEEAEQRSIESHRLADNAAHRDSKRETQAEYAEEQSEGSRGGGGTVQHRDAEQGRYHRAGPEGRPPQGLREGFEPRVDPSGGDEPLQEGVGDLRQSPTRGEARPNIERGESDPKHLSRHCRRDHSGDRSEQRPEAHRCGNIHKVGRYRGDGNSQEGLKEAAGVRASERGRGTGAYRPRPFVVRYRQRRGVIDIR